MEKKIVKNKISLKEKAASRTVAKPVAKSAAKSAEKKERLGLHMIPCPKGAHKPRKQLGRGAGSGHGKTSTRGSKGQTSRAGRDMYLGFEGGQTPLIRRIPKRGFTSAHKLVFQLVPLTKLAALKESVITLELLALKGIIKNEHKLVKILGDGDVLAGCTVYAHAFSKSAADKIKKAGGKIEIVHL